MHPKLSSATWPGSTKTETTGSASDSAPEPISSPTLAKPLPVMQRPQEMLASADQVTIGLKNSAPPQSLTSINTDPPDMERYRGRSIGVYEIASGVFKLVKVPFVVAAVVVGGVVAGP